MSLAIQRECRRTGAVSRVLPIPLAATDEQIVQIVRAGLRPGRTRLLVVDQLTSATARLFPAAAIVGVAREHGVPVLVDAAHAPGMLPTTVAGIGADFWVGNLHKWAYAPRGHRPAGGGAAVAGPDRAAGGVLGAGVGFPGPASSGRRRSTTRPGWPPRRACSRCAVSASTGCGRTTPRSPRTASGWWGTRSGCAPADLPDPGGPGVALRLIPLPAGMATTIDAARALQARIGERLAAEVAVMSWSGRGWLRLSRPGLQRRRRVRAAGRAAAGAARPALTRRARTGRPVRTPGPDRPAAGAPGRGRAGPAGRDIPRPGAGPSAGTPRPGNPGARAAARPAASPAVTGCAGTYGGSDRLVGGPQPVGVPHGDHRSTGHQTGEEHGARPGAADHRSGRARPGRRRGGRAATAAAAGRTGAPDGEARRAASGTARRAPGRRPARPPAATGTVRRRRRGSPRAATGTVGRRWSAGHRRTSTASPQSRSARAGQAQSSSSAADRTDGWLSHDAASPTPVVRQLGRRGCGQPEVLWTTTRTAR